MAAPRVTIIGLGLLGGSFGMAIRRNGVADEVIGVDLTQDILDRACARGAIDRGTLDAATGMAQADLVVLAMPVRSMVRALPELALHLPESAVLFDLGSTKKRIQETVASLSRPVRYVGGHPMAGTEHAGIEAADAGLFSGATFALVPPVPPDEDAMEQLTALIRAIGAHPTRITAERHDRIVAMTSHLPYLLSSTLVQSAALAAEKEPLLWDFVAGGFRDTSRVAASNVRVMVDICMTNREPIREGIERARRILTEMERWIVEDADQALETALMESRSVRTRVFGERGRVMQTKKVGFQGERGAFSEMAALEYFGDVAEAVPYPSFAEVFKAVEQGHCDHGMLPIENSLAGSIHGNYDLLLRHNLYIIGEIKLRIAHNLLALPGVKLEDLRQAQSHPVALEQCLGFFRNYPQIQAASVYDTAGAAKMLRESGARDTAAIAGTRAAEHYGLDILQKGIEDNPQNFTRFLVLAPAAVEPAGDRIKTTIVFSVPHEPGTLFRAMSVFALRDISICKIESRPLIGSPWEYLFYLDFIGRATSLVCSRALNHLQESATYFKLLGSYEEGRTVEGA
jgi:prephenate dehydratase/prephenate dehydrogenase